MHINTSKTKNTYRKHM